MGFFKCLLLVALLAHDVAAQPSWMGFQKMAPTTTAPGPPPQLPQRANALPELQQSKEPGTQAPVDTCHVEEGEKIQCGLPEITAEQCYAVDCCFDGQQCYYGQTGTYPNPHPSCVLIVCCMWHLTHAYLNVVHPCA